MESHILNPTYHQARFRPIGHKILRMKSDSLSSESSCNQNSPEYPQISVSQPRHLVDSNGDWCIENQTMNTTQSSQDTSSDDDSSGPEESMEDTEVNEVQDNAEESEEEELDNIEVCEVNVDDDDNVDEEVEVLHSNSLRNMQINGANSIEENTLVEGHDYDIITVYTVNPDLDLIEPSSDDDTEDYAINEKDDANYQQTSTLSQNGLDINLAGPVVSNVDEYFIKNNNNEQHILDSDEPVVKDVDEYFIKDKGKVTAAVPNIDDFFIKHKLPEEESTQFQLPVSNVQEYFVTDNEQHASDKVKPEPQLEPEPELEPEPVLEPEPEPVPEPESEVEPETAVADVSINESDLEVLPNIEDIKRYLLDDMTYTKFRHNQKSCSVPHSPMQNLCMDIDDAKTCLSFEDLNLDLSDLAFDNDKDKSDSVNKSDDLPRTLTDEDVNSFLITNKNSVSNIKIEEDDLSHQDMEIDRPVEPTFAPEPAIIAMPSRKMTSTPIPKVLDFCIEKTSIKKEPAPEVKEPKVEVDDFVDVESCNDTVVPVLEANNLSSLLEQFEATEKLNTKKRPVPTVKTEDPKAKSFNKTALTNGMRLQDAGVQLNKNKMRQILMPTPINSTVRRSQSPVHSDHDYCSSKKRHSLPNLKGGQSLLKPEVLSSNSRILNSRHRSCKSRKVVYHLSSDEETEGNNSKNKKVNKPDDIDAKKKISVKPSVKPPVQSNCRKKLSPPHSAPDSFKDKDKSNSSVMIKSASKASDNCSQNSNGSIKLTIKNKSEVILNCDHVDSQKSKNIDKCKNSVSDKTNNVEKEKQDKNIKELDRHKTKVVSSVETVTVKEEPRPKNENFYTALFSNKQDVQIPHSMQPKTEKRPFEEELNKCMEAAIKKEEQPQKKKKLNLQEYKLRRSVCSNNSSAQVSPEAIFPDMPLPGLEKAVKCPITQTPPSGLLNTTNKVNNEQTFFDPIKEASRKILMNTKKQKAEAMRKRDEDIVMSKIPKVENLELQPLISDAEMMKIVGMTQPEVLPLPVVNEKPQLSADYEEIILVSIGVNTDEKMFPKPEPKVVIVEKTKAPSPPADAKSLINFRIKKSDHVLKQNVFDNVKRDKRSPIDEKKHIDTKIDKERYKDITATLKSVEKQVETKISSNSLFASIQDVVMKKAPEEMVEKSEERHSKLKSPVRKRDSRPLKTTIVREYDPKAEHGEDKVILHLGKNRNKPTSATIVIQTDSMPEFDELPPLSPVKEIPVSRKRNDSDMSMSSEGSPTRQKEVESPKPRKSDDRVVKPKEVRPERIERETKEKRSRSKDRYDSKYRRRSRSVSRGRRRRSRSRSRSRSRGRYRRYRRSDSPYKRKRRSRSPYHKRRSPSIRRDRSKISRSRSRSPPRQGRPEARSHTPVKKTRPSPHPSSAEKKMPKSLTPPLRKPTVSESSDSSTSSSSSSSSSSTSSSSSGSRQSRRSCSPYQNDEYKMKGYRSYSSEDRESNTPVEERRIVFVGRLEKDVNKSTLRSQFSKFGTVLEVRLHSKEDGSRYGFVTFQRARDAWSAVEAASTFPQYDVGFGGRRAFCRQSYADLDGLEAKYTESAFHGATATPIRRDADMSFEQMLLEMKKKLSQRKNDKKRDDPKP